MSSAQDVRVGMIVRIDDGPKAGTQGKVVDVTMARQLGTNIETVTIEFEDGTRSARPFTSPVTIIPQSLPSGEPNPYPGVDGSCTWCGGMKGHESDCPLRTAKA